MTGSLEASDQQVEDSYLLLIRAHESAIRMYKVLGRSERAERERAALEMIRNSHEEWRCRSAAAFQPRSK